jgi:amidase
MTHPWQERAQEKRAAILAAIPKEWHIDNPRVEEQVDVTGKYIQQYLSGREVEITETTAERIVGKIAKGEWKSEEVVRAFCHRAALAHQLVCCSVSNGG